MSDDQQRPAEQRDWVKAQLALVTLSLFLLITFQSIQLIRDRASLSELATAQEPTIQEGIKLRRQLDTLAGKTAQLAAEGDASAGAIISDLRRQGITVRAPAAAP